MITKSKFINFFGLKLRTNIPAQSALARISGFGSLGAVLLLARVQRCSLNLAFSKISKLENKRFSKKIENWKKVVFGKTFLQQANYYMARLRTVGSMSYRRRGDGLPVRGQRTHSNAMTFRRYYVKYAHWKHRQVGNKNRRFYFTRKPRKVLSHSPKKAQRPGWTK